MKLLPFSPVEAAVFERTIFAAQKKSAEDMAGYSAAFYLTSNNFEMNGKLKSFELR